MADTAQPPTQTGLSIPADTQAKFAALIELIKGSESMNNEERQYWINILPVMTPEQITNLQDILQSEKDQLAAIDAKYAQAASAAPGTKADDIGRKIRSQKEKRAKTESEDDEAEINKEQDILSKIQAL